MRLITLLGAVCALAGLAWSTPSFDIPDEFIEAMAWPYPGSAPTDLDDDSGIMIVFPADYVRSLVKGYQTRDGELVLDIRGIFYVAPRLGLSQYEEEFVGTSPCTSGKACRSLGGLCLIAKATSDDGVYSIGPVIRSCESQPIAENDIIGSFFQGACPACETGSRTIIHRNLVGNDYAFDYKLDESNAHLLQQVDAALSEKFESWRVH